MNCSTPACYARLLAGVIAALAAVISVLPAQIVQLRNGQTVLGKIEQPDDSGFRLRRFDNGGVLELRWQQLAPETVERVKSLFQLSLDDDTEFMIDADRVVVASAGGGRETIIGRILPSESGNGKLVIQRQTTRFELDSKRIRQHEKVSVPVLDVYTVDRFYADQLDEIQPGEDADKHVLIADVMMRVRAYQRAEEHLKKAELLGTVSQPAALKGKVERLALLKAAKAETELLDQIRTMMARGQWKRGLDSATAYEQKFGEKGKLALEFERVRKRFDQARARAVGRLVVDRWFRLEQRLSRQIAGRPISFEKARDLAESELGKEIRASIATGLRLEPDEVETLWAKREELGTAGRPSRYSYGVASWLLGKQAVIKDTAVAKAKSKAGQGRKARPAEDSRARRVREQIERLRRAQQKNGAGAANENSPNAWWESATRDQRASFLRAYYAEFGGDRTVVSAHADPCITCGGRGFVEVTEADGKRAKPTCPTCRGTAYKRWLYAR